MAADEVILLDRDGTIVVDRHYLDDPSGLEFLPAAAEGLRQLHAAGHRLVVVTNQSGIGRGMFSVARLEAIHARLQQMVIEAGARLDAIYFCPHAPDADCDCRKPRLGLMRRAVAELGFDPAAAVVIGDKQSDVEFGKRARAATILIGSALPPAATTARPTVNHLAATADLVAPDLLAAARWIQQRRG
jgi:D-glycero-D-manno-heptose 1,7-bisphosphate phosphatase